MHKQTSIDTSLQSLMATLSHRDGLLRQKARESLVLMGEPAVPALCHELEESKSKQVRWEAAKALGAIDDTKSIPTLVKALEDKDSDVRWLAAVALNKFGQAAWRPLLQRLVESGVDSVALCEGTHHVFFNQKVNGFNDLIDQLQTGLEFGSVAEAGSIAATEILKRIREQDNA